MPCPHMKGMEENSCSHAGKDGGHWGSNCCCSDSDMVIVGCLSVSSRPNLPGVIHGIANPFLSVHLFSREHFIGLLVKRPYFFLSDTKHGAVRQVLNQSFAHLNLMAALVVRQKVEVFRILHCLVQGYSLLRHTSKCSNSFSHLVNLREVFLESRQIWIVV